MIRVVLQDENGKGLSQGIDVPSNLLARLDDSRFSCLCFVDPYGDTVFNRVQAVALLADLRLLRGCESHPHEAAIQAIEKLVRQCQEEPHLYIKLIGD
jgi:hypothetical protein